MISKFPLLATAAGEREGETQERIISLVTVKKIQNNN